MSTRSPRAWRRLQCRLPPPPPLRDCREGQRRKNGPIASLVNRVARASKKTLTRTLCFGAALRRHRRLTAHRQSRTGCGNRPHERARRFSAREAFSFPEGADLRRVPRVSRKRVQRFWRKGFRSRLSRFRASPETRHAQQALLESEVVQIWDVSHEEVEIRRRELAPVDHSEDRTPCTAEEFAKYDAVVVSTRETSCRETERRR